MNDRNVIGKLCILIGLCWSCKPSTPLSPEQHNAPTNYTFVDPVSPAHMDTIYVPIYSDIYDQTVDSKSLLTATLSIRNTSMRDSIYIVDVDYYDTQGKLVRGYLDKTLLLTPLQSTEYIVEEADDTGGTGANFIITWGGNSAKIKPIFQAVMVLKSGQHALSFVTQGLSISEYADPALD